MFEFHLKWWKTPFFLQTTRQEALIWIEDENPRPAASPSFFFKDVTQIDAQKQKLLFCFLVPDYVYLNDSNLTVERKKKMQPTTVIIIHQQAHTHTHTVDTNAHNERWHDELTEELCLDKV